MSDFDFKLITKIKIEKNEENEIIISLEDDGFTYSTEPFKTFKEAKDYFISSLLIKCRFNCELTYRDFVTYYTPEDEEERQDIFKWEEAVDNLLNELGISYSNREITSGGAYYDFEATPEDLLAFMERYNSHCGPDGFADDGTEGEALWEAHKDLTKIIDDLFPNDLGFFSEGRKVNEDTNMRVRIIYDLCTPTKDRRPTTSEDIENDIVVKDLNSEEDLLDEVIELTDWDEYDLEEYLEDNDMQNASTKEKIETLLNIFDDPGDGSPNILYCSINGEELDGSLPYDCLDNLDLEHCSRDDVVNTCMREFAEDDIDEEDFEDEELDDDDDYEPIKSFYDRYSEEEIKDIIKFITEWIKKQPDYESIKNTLTTDQGVEKYLGKIVLSSEDENGKYWKLYKDIIEEENKGELPDGLGAWIDDILTDIDIFSDINNALNSEDEEDNESLN